MKRSTPKTRKPLVRAIVKHGRTKTDARRLFASLHLPTKLRRDIRSHRADKARMAHSASDDVGA
jgi:hypothetical protein